MECQLFFFAECHRNLLNLFKIDFVRLTMAYHCSNSEKNHCEREVSHTQKRSCWTKSLSCPKTKKKIITHRVLRLIIEFLRLTDRAYTCVKQVLQFYIWKQFDVHDFPSITAISNNQCIFLAVTVASEKSPNLGKHMRSGKLVINLRLACAKTNSRCLTWKLMLIPLPQKGH